MSPRIRSIDVMDTLVRLQARVRADSIEDVAAMIAHTLSRHNLEATDKNIIAALVEMARKSPKLFHGAGEKAPTLKPPKRLTVPKQKAAKERKRWAFKLTYP